ncbi:hypothetical protein LZ32DRAFT_289428 [Colletotrichum eremochloae]|nr:hypothetical protein LZ32DRAFT_289428 [Colletotrichum eremochloae]
MNPHHDLQHGWVHGKRIKNPPWPAALRLFGSIFPVSRETLPRVEAVNCLIIRRQLRRCIHPRALGILLDSLEGLEHISYEPWTPYQDLYRSSNDQGLKTMLLDHLPGTTKRLVVFEDAYRFPKPPAPIHPPLHTGSLAKGLVQLLHIKVSSYRTLPSPSG